MRIIDKPTKPIKTDDYDPEVGPRSIEEFLRVVDRRPLRDGWNPNLPSGFDVRDLLSLPAEKPYRGKRIKGVPNWVYDRLEAFKWMSSRFVPVPKEWKAEPGTTVVGNNAGTFMTAADAAKRIAAISYLVKGFVPRGMITGVVAEPGTGKSAFLLHAIARPLLTGCRWFNGAKGPNPGKVIWCGTENDLAITIDRAQKWRIPLDGLILPHDDLSPIDLTNQKDIKLIKKLVEKFDAQAVIVDSLRGGHDTDENSSRVGRMLQDLAGIAEQTGVAMLVAHHTRKLGFDEEITANSSRGSNAILAMMRAQIGIDKPLGPKSTCCRVRMLKNNLGLAPEPLGFEITEFGLIYGSAPDRNNERAPVLAEIKASLESLLGESGGKMAADDILEGWAKSEGLCIRTLKTAKKELGIQSKRIGGRDGTWHWILPDSEVEGKSLHSLHPLHPLKPEKSKSAKSVKKVKSVVKRARDE